MKQISTNAPSLGGVIAMNKIVPTIAVGNANRPYIMGSAVFATSGTDGRNPIKCHLGNTGGKVAGIMCLGMPQVYQYGKFVESYEASNNNVGLKGTFYAALDLAKFEETKILALNGNGVLSVDKNGVFSYSDAVVQTEGSGTTENTIAVSSAVVVLNYFATPILEAFEKTFNVGGTNYTYKYPKGIGAISISF